jgi:ankyrin repeat protein
MTGARTIDELPTQLVGEFVIAAHRDLSRVRALLARTPALLKARAIVSGSQTDDPRLNSESALQAAVHMGNRKIATFLLDAGEEVDFCAAAMLGMTEFVEQSLRGNPQLIDANGAHGIPILYIVALGGHVEIAESFLRRGADIERQYAGQTPLHVAARCGHATLAAYLVARGADVSFRDSKGRTPAILARDFGHEWTAHVLGQLESTFTACEQPHH